MINDLVQKGISFLSLIENNKILIPKIQRDYAQGRLDPKASEIRDSFLSAVFDTLLSMDSETLLLDFIYGSTQNAIFTPLDGQQRLTTLFLLHWYFIPQDKKSLLYLSDGNSCYSQFSYETRISSKDFCNALVTYSSFDLKLLQIQENLLNNQPKKYLSDIIKNQTWFLWSWRKDPTIKAMLIMLDDIDKRSDSLDESKRLSLWEQLTNGKIRFHLLPLEQFALTDELYVKMNARGKELSPFDIFKSTLEEQMRLNGVSEDLQNKWRENIDSNWIDIFWNKLAKPHLDDNIKPEEQRKFVDSVEEGYLRFLKRMMEFHMLLNDNCFICDWNDENIKRYVPFEYTVSTEINETETKNILNKIWDYPFKTGDILDLVPLFCKTKFFNNNFFEFVIGAFESLVFSKELVKLDGSELVEGVLFENKQDSLFNSFINENIDYETRAQFFAVIKYFEYNPAISVERNLVLKAEFNSWIRVIRNLSTNTNTYFYNAYDDLQKSLKAIEKWSMDVYFNQNLSSIDNYLRSPEKLDGFNNEQLSEEKIKASLISDANWKEAIRKAEEHPYFLGQIRFLLEWSFENGQYNLESFKNYYEKILYVFADNGLKPSLFENHLFRNTMMTYTDWYLLNNCFVQNTSKSRDWSWKRYLREGNVSINIKGILDGWDQTIEFESYCLNRVNGDTVNDWRRCFLDRPEIYDELFDNKISSWNSNTKEICLLSKTRWSSKHKELKTFYLYKEFKDKNDLSYLDSTDESHPFSVVFKKENNKEFSVKFIPKWDGEWTEGQYVVSSNFDAEIEEMKKDEATTRWEMYVNSSQFQVVEEMTKVLNLK